jgi:hypothetical protein
MTHERLRNRRRRETFALELYGLHYVASVSRFDDGRVAEVSYRVTSQLHKAIPMQGAALSPPRWRQYGCPLDVLRRALLRDAQGKPSTPLGCALDAIAEQKEAGDERNQRSVESSAPMSMREQRRR